MRMTDYSIAEAKNNLPKLVDRAAAGEAVTITRRGKAVAKIVPVAEPKGMSIDLEWLERVRVKPSGPKADGTPLWELMRREDRY
jgi:prevent-host-death family protein